ncbi:hypothetical protein [uncultured Mucilaginibacter sp.]|uniref:hypothetical protein n=1 Tax=uncultured Mucilaginibacter sp. TaxID=797541 RepID=UPI002636DE90|nr:hypothetical protein [uncultured Mucilaginibacter sp.]
MTDSLRFWAETSLGTGENRLIDGKWQCFFYGIKISGVRSFLQKLKIIGIV